MPPRDLIVIGGSAGSWPALLTLAAWLPPGLPARVLVALHTPRQMASTGCAVLNRGSQLPVRLARDGTALVHRTIYLIPGEMQARIKLGYMRVVEADEGDRFRPCIDTLFRTAAHTYGRRVIGVVLSGMLNDGAAGLAAIVRAGGVGVIQSPAEAEFASMPLHAQEAAPESYCLPVIEMAPLLTELVAAPASLESLAAPAWAREQAR